MFFPIFHVDKCVFNFFHFFSHFDIFVHFVHAAFLMCSSTKKNLKTIPEVFLIISELLQKSSDSDNVCICC